MNSAPAGSMYVNPKHSPLHGEYGLYKSANIKGKSGDEKNGTDGYLWWTKAQLSDRTYENTMAPNMDISSISMPPMKADRLPKLISRLTSVWVRRLSSAQPLPI